MADAEDEVPKSPEADEEQEGDPEQKEDAEVEQDAAAEEETPPQEEQAEEETGNSVKEQEATEEKEQDEQGSRPPSTTQPAPDDGGGAGGAADGGAPPAEHTNVVEDQDEDVELDENMNYLQELRNILEKFKHVQQIESDDEKIETLTTELKQYKRGIKGAKLYFAEGVKVTSEVRLSITDIVQDVFNKIKEQHKPFDKAGEQKTRSELEAVESANNANKAKLKALEQLQELLALAAECEQSAAEATEDLAKAAQLSNELDEATGALKDQMAEDAQQGEGAQQDESEKQAELERERELEEERRLEEERLEEERRIQEEEERAARLKEEEERRAKYEPTTWPVFGYKDADDSEDVLLVIRAPPDTLQQSQFTVTQEDELTSSFKLCPNEELVSNIIHVKPQEDNLEASGPIWIACPHVFPRGTNYREPWLKICLGKSSTDEGDTQEQAEGEEGEKGEKKEQPAEPKVVEWKMVDHSRDTTIPDNKSRFVESAFNSVSEMTLAVVSRIKEDIGQVNNKGGKIASTVDTRCNIQVPKNAFKSLTEFGIKLFPVDSKLMEDMKNIHNKQAGNLIAMSPYVDVRLDNKNMKKPVIFSITNPGANRKRNDQAGSGGPNDNKGGLSVKGTAIKNEGLDEKLYLFVGNDNNQWTVNNAVSFTYERDVVSFKMESIIKRFILIRTQGDCTPGDGNFIIKTIIEKTKEVTTHMVVRQNDDGELSLHCVRADKLDKLNQSLISDHYTEGNSSKPLTMFEGQVITVKFRGNVNFETNEVRKYQFNSNRDTFSDTGAVRVVDRYQQHGLEVFRGHTQFFTEPEPVPPPPASQAQKDKAPPPGPKPRLLCELPVVLMKTEYASTQVNRAPIKIREHGPLTNKYIDDLSKEIGDDEWRPMAEKLGVSGPGIQRITRSQDGVLEGMVKDMLLTWFKTAKSSTDKVQTLYHTLKEIDREDLAVVLEKENHQFQVESENKLQEVKWKKAYRAVTDSVKAMKNWNKLATTLGVDESVINDISQKTQITEREKVWEVLAKWREEKGEDSSREILVQALKTCQFIEASENVNHIG